MAGSLNKVILIGNLGKDPEVRKLPSGEPVVNLRVATSETWRDKQSGERKEKTEWHAVTIFNEQIAKVAEQYLKKGMKIYVEGALQTRKWQDQSGADKYSTEIVLQKYRGELQMLDSKGGCGSDRSSEYDQSEPSFSGSSKKRAMAGPKESFSADLDDEIPF